MILLQIMTFFVALSIVPMCFWIGTYTDNLHVPPQKPEDDPIQEDVTLEYPIPKL